MKCETKYKTHVIFHINQYKVEAELSTMEAEMYLYYTELADTEQEN